MELSLAFQNKGCFLALILFILVPDDVFATEPFCGDLKVERNIDGVGPWDYRDPENSKLLPGSRFKNRYELVEKAHFTAEVESLKRGKTGLLPFTDIDYTLYRFPNHPRALWAISRLQRRDGELSGPISRVFSTKKLYAECYFQRAIKYYPDDAVIKMLYAMHFHLAKNYKNAEFYYQQASNLDPGSAETKYNLALLYFDTKNFSKSLEYAKLAYSLGYPLLGLKEKLKSRGLWKE